VRKHLASSSESLILGRIREPDLGVVLAGELKGDEDVGHPKQSAINFDTAVGSGASRCIFLECDGKLHRIFQNGSMMYIMLSLHPFHPLHVYLGY
jgi:hypothetical protein